jgi:hypothetical protein
VTTHQKHGHVLWKKSCIVRATAGGTSKRVVMPSDMQKVTTPVSSSGSSVWVSNEP